MRVVLLLGNQPNQIALANKIVREFDVVGLIIEEKRSKRKIKKNILFYMEKFLDRSLFFPIRHSWIKLQQYYKTQYPTFASTPLLHASNINSEKSVDFIKKMQPDIIAVSGTRIIRKGILDLKPKFGIINLHTGLSPYIKGGPNCTNWCIALNKFQLIGNTIMWIDAGIDSGNIIATEQTPIEGVKTLSELHIRVMEHAHELYVRALHKIEREPEAVKRVAQDSICQGKTYYNKDWNWKNKWRLIRNLKKIKNGKSDPDSPITIPL